MEGKEWVDGGYGNDQELVRLMRGTPLCITRTMRWWADGAKARRVLKLVSISQACGDKETVGAF